MSRRIRRRRFLISTSVLGLGVLGEGLSAAGEEPAGSQPATSPAGPAEVHREFPRQSPEEVREVVAVSHFDLDRVRELVTARPALARAAWDWGFGDWESALGAAAHTGRREIAELLIEHGARPTIFSAAMLGQLEIVRAFVETTPGLRSLPGPHGIPLLAHARAGGSRARAVVDYLESLDDTDRQPIEILLNEDGRRRFAGRFAYGPGRTERLDLLAQKGGQLAIQRPGHPARRLHRRGASVFHPAGAPDVRIVFRIEDDRVVSLTVHDADLVVTARRID